MKFLNLGFMLIMLLLAGCGIQPKSLSGDVYARQVPERMDDFAFENDKVAFRVYGPALKDSAENSGTDCWLKRIDYPIIDKWYKEETEGKSYHVDHGEGYDPYHVGSSLGCGGIAIWEDGAERGDHLKQPNVYKNYKIIELTEDKVVFELKYEWQDLAVEEAKRITLEKGHQLYKAESTFTKDGKPVQIEVAVGVTTHDGKARASVNLNGNIVTTWEIIDESGVGTAIVLPDGVKARYVEQSLPVKDRSHALLVTSTDKAGKITYYAGFAWQKAGEITHHADWKAYTRTYLNPALDVSGITPATVNALTRRVADWQIETFFEQGKYRALPTVPPDWMNREQYHDLEWQHGALYAGMNEWRKIADEPKYTEWLKDIGERNQWKLHQRPYHADDHTVGQFYLALYEDFHKPEMLNPVREQFDWILSNRKTGTLAWEAENTHAHDRWGWCDALFMAPPVWARLAKVTGDPKYLAFMDEEYHTTYDLLWSEKDHLFWRDSSYFSQSEKNGEDIFWARGNGWVFGGLALMIPDLPKNWEGRQFYIDLFKKMAKRLKSIQRADGTWSMGLLGGTEGYPIKETSGTSFYTFGLAWGINQGLLDKETYEPTVLRAWQALTDAINDDGMLGYVQPVGAAPGDSFADYTEVYGTGAFLAAGSELYKMLQTPPAVEKQQNLLTFVHNAGWCWFQEPRAIIQNDILLIGGVAGNGPGEAVVGIYDIDEEMITGRTVVAPRFDHDDHNSPAFYARADGSVLTVYARHSTENKHYYRISGSDDFLEWGEQLEKAYAYPVTYMNLLKLEDEQMLYNFYRGIDWNPTFTTSRDEGLTWSKEQHFIQNEVEGYQRPYARYAGNGKDTIGVSFTDAHPRQFGNSLYFAAFRGGNFYKVDGTFIKSLEKDGPLRSSEAEKVYQGSGNGFRAADLSAENSAWILSLTLDEKGYPHLGYVVYLSNMDHRYRIASWNGTGWIDREVAFAGTRLYDLESSYTGLLTLDSADPNHVVISTDVNPKTGVALGGKHQIFRAHIRIEDNRESINWEQLTNDPAQHNIRPLIVPGDNKRAIVWMRGQYNSYTDYYVDAVGFIEAN